LKLERLEKRLDLEGGHEGVVRVIAELTPTRTRR
jgi:hypothetical protein